jgi:transposase
MAWFEAASYRRRRSRRFATSHEPASSSGARSPSTRTRKQLGREVAQHTNRIQKVLEDTNIKIASAISDVLGKSGRAILDALVAGETEPEKLVALCSGRLKASRKVLTEALRGRVTDHHRFLLKLHLGQVDLLQQAMRDLEARVGDSKSVSKILVSRSKSVPRPLEFLASPTRSS